MANEDNPAIQTITDINGESIVEEITSQITNQEEKDKVKTKLYELGVLQLFNLKKTGHDETALDIYKKEYEIASTRFENIYKAIWQNFSYMSVVAGGLLTFGNNFFTATTNSNNKYLVTFLACVPLLFWYVSTFVPMNDYGYKAADELAEIEGKINGLFNVNMTHFKSFKERRSRIWHIFTSPSVRSMMLIFFVILSVIAFINFIDAFQLLPIIEAQRVFIIVIPMIILVLGFLVWAFWSKGLNGKLPSWIIQILVNDKEDKGIAITKQSIQTFIILIIFIWGYFLYQWLITFNVYWSLWILGFLLASNIWIILLEAQRIYERVVEKPQEQTNPIGNQ